MASYGWKDIKVIILGGFDFQGYRVEELTLPGSRAVLDEVVGAGNTWPDSFDTGSRRTKQPITLKLMFDDTATTGPGVFAASLAQQSAFAIGVEGDVIGAKVNCGLLATMTQGNLPESEKKTRMALEVGVSEYLDAAIQLCALGTSRTGTFNTDASSYNSGTQGSALTITDASVANPTVITTSAAHGLTTGDTVLIAGSDSTPSLDGSHTVTVTGATTFTVAVNVTVQGTTGTATLTSTRNGGRAYFFTTALSLDGYDSVTPAVRHSADNVTFASLSAGTTVTAAPAHQGAAVTGVVNRYLSMSSTLVGTGTSPTWNTLVAFFRVPN